MDIRTRIKHRIWDRGWTQADLAAEIGMSEGHLSRMLNRGYPISERAAYLMSRELDIPLDQFQPEAETVEA